jgi:hypothetical protein
MKRLKRHFWSRMAVLITLTLLFTCNPMGSAAYAEGAMDSPIPVSDEATLIDAITSADNSGEAVTIELTTDIETMQTITIPKGADITLIGKYEIKMMNNGPTLSVISGATLRIDGITVTHAPATIGMGVTSRGTLYLMSGLISGNTSSSYGGGGGGVYFHGRYVDGLWVESVFNMSGGEISGNASEGRGGGVRADGTFNMSGGEISGNVSEGTGGGVYATGTFNMSGGTISDNVALGQFGGGGVYSGGSLFNMIGGTISGNIAPNGFGGGVYVPMTLIIDAEGYPHYPLTFNMRGGKISGNEAKIRGGGVYNAGTFHLDGGTISDNTSDKGGGICNDYGSAYDQPSGLFVEGGTISGNEAKTDGGGIFTTGYKVCSISGAAITGNKAGQSGGGILWLDQPMLKNLHVASDVIFSDNSAHTPYDRKPEDDGVYMANIKCTTWTSPFRQGYNNYDISYMGLDYKGDVDGPVISGFLPFVTEVKAGGEVRFEIDIKDPSGLGQPHALLIPPAGSSTAPLTATLTKSTGNTFSGLWNIPANAPAGQWQVRFECADTPGNFTTWNPTSVITVAGANASGGTQSQAVTLTLDRATLTLDIGGTVALKAEQKRGTVISSYPNLDWISDRSDVATVDVYGKVTAKGPGTAIIRVTGDEGVTATCTVTVNAPAAEKGGGNTPDTPAGNGATPGISGGTDGTTTSPGGNQTDGATATAAIPRVALKTVRAGKGKMTVTWKKASAAAKVTGYQIQVRVKGSAKWKTKSIHVKKASVAFTKLKVGKRYQVRIRAYRFVDGKTHYGGWSKAFVSGKVKCERV